VATRPCVPPSPSGTPYSPFGPRPCPLPPGPGPTTLIANGTVYTIKAGQVDNFQFEPSLASAASLTGGFMTTHGGAVYVMTPLDFANFSSTGASSYQCNPAAECFATANASAGNVTDCTVSGLIST
jgi:hypothetical protein